MRLYIQANTIIPVPGIENYVIGIGESPTGDVSLVRGASALAQTFARNKNDGVTRFLRGVAGLAKNRLPDKTRPDRESKWAGGDPYGALLPTCGTHGRFGAIGK